MTGTDRDPITVPSGTGGRRTIERVAFWAAVAVTVVSPIWLPYTPLRSMPFLGFLLLFVGWGIYASVRRSTRGLVGLGAGLAVFVAFGLVTGLALAPILPPTLTASPVEVSKLVDLSRFRSCAGHDFSAAYVDDPGATETDRSMKHYLSLSDTYGSGVEVPVLAVADGTITKAATMIANEGSNLTDAGDFNGEVTLLAATNPMFGTWNVRYMHVHPTRKVGERVKAGDTIATVPPKDWAKVRNVSNGAAALPPTTPIQFDVAVEYSPLLPVGTREASYVSMLSSSLTRSYADAGYTVADTVISRAARDAAPCNGRYNVDAAADWVNADRVRAAADGAAATGSTNGSSNMTTSTITAPAARPSCTDANLGQSFTDPSGNWKCMRSAEGNLTWGPA